MKRRRWEDYSSGEKLFTKILFCGLGLLLVASGIAELLNPSHSRSTQPMAVQRQSPPESASVYASGAVPPAATVDGVTYTGAQQVGAMTQAAKDAGMDEATAQRVGREAVALCNGNPDCLR